MKGRKGEGEDAQRGVQPRGAKKSLKTKGGGWGNSRQRNGDRDGRVLKVDHKFGVADLMSENSPVQGQPRHCGTLVGSH